MTYVREEVLFDAWAAQLRTLRLDSEVVTWVRTALQQSHDDLKITQRDAVGRLREQYDRVSERMTKAYEDKLDGLISAAFYEQKAKEWKEDMSRLMRSMESHNSADEAYMDLGVALVELADRTVELFQWANDAEKRQLLEFLCANAVWRDGALEVNWRKPFDLLAESPTAPTTKNALGGDSEGVFAKWLPTIDGARTRYQGVFLRLSKRFPRVRRGGQAKAVPVKRTVSPEERAARWAAMIDGEVVKTRADLARALGVSRARVTQVLGAT